MYRRRTLASLVGNARGNSVVEFALVLPILLLVVFGITEFGRAWLTVNALTTAAREGARLAVVTAPDVGAVTARVQQVCTASKIEPTSINVTGPLFGDPSRAVTVEVTTNFTVIPGRILGDFSGTLSLRGRSTMRHESI